MIVYITQGERTSLAAAAVEGLPIWRLTVGRGYFARRRAAGHLRRLYDGGVRRGAFETEILAALAEKYGIGTVPVLPLRLAVLEQLLDALCGEGLRGGAVELRVGPGGEAAGRRAAAALARRVRYIRLADGDPAGLTGLLMENWGISPGSGGLPAALTVCTGYDAPETEGRTLYLTEDCARVQAVTYEPSGLPEPLLAALVDSGRWLPSQIRVASVASLLDIRRENHYNAT